MEEPSRIVQNLRDRKATEALSVIPAPSVLSWEQVPREPHLLDYIIILRKHQWMILTFLLDRSDHCYDRVLQDEASLRGVGARGSG